MDWFRIIEERKNYYLVDIPGKEPVKALLKGIVRKKYRRLSVGDFVKLTIFDEEKGEAQINSVKKRFNELPKPTVANIDQVVFVNCYKEPKYDLNYINRFLFSASVNGIEVVLFFNKEDLLDDDEKKELSLILDYYREIGYETYSTSMEDNASVELVKELSKGKLSVFAGPSGVGKSSLMSKIFPNYEFITNELSKHISRGKNTTTHTSLLKLHNGYIADTPGFSMMKIPKVDPIEVREHFKEIDKVGENCKFSNCYHENEPHCAVKEAVDNEEIWESRYFSYLDLLDLMRDVSKDYKNKNRYV